MEFLFCLAALLVGGAGGYLMGRAAPEIRRIKKAASIGQHDSRLPGMRPILERQYQNFLSYDGTERGQHDFED